MTMWKYTSLVYESIPSASQQAALRIALPPDRSMETTTEQGEYSFTFLRNFSLTVLTHLAPFLFTQMFL